MDESTLREKIIGSIECMTGEFTDGLEKLSTRWLMILHRGLSGGDFASVLNSKQHARFAEIWSKYFRDLPEN